MTAMPRPIPSELLPLRYEAAGYHFAVPSRATARHDVDPQAITSVVLTFDDEPLVITSTTEDSALDSPDLQVNGQLGLLLATYRDRSPSLQIHDRALVGVDGSDAAVLADVSWGERDRHRALLLCARLAGRRLLTLQAIHPDRSTVRLHPLATGVIDSLTVEPTATPGTFVDRYGEIRPGESFT